MPLDWELITPEVIISLDLDIVVGRTSERECSAYGVEIAALLADEVRWDKPQLEALRFVGSVLSMTLSASNPAEPFGPAFVFGNERGPIPGDYPRQELLALLPCISALADDELRARLLDLTWLQGKSFEAAKGAVRAYLESATRLEPASALESERRLERALRLATTLGKGGQDLQSRVLHEAEAMLERQGGAEFSYTTLRLVRLLLEFEHGQMHRMALICETAARRAEAEGNFWQARDYHEAAADCHVAAGDSAARLRSLSRSAEALVLEAEAALGQAGRGAIAAANITAQAIKAMRSTPGGKERADELHARLLQLQSSAMAEMKPISTSMESTDLVQAALTAVRGKSFRDAVVQLCGMVGPLSIDRLRKQVHDQARIAILGSLISNDIVNSRGRVVAKSPPLVAGASDPGDPGLRSRMFQIARLRRSLTVQAVINPARVEITTSHSPSREEVIELIRHSPWIPPGHMESVARALLAGFQGDMLVVAHMVVPQFEALVRHVVEIAGGTTTNFDAQGLQPEKPLNVLLDTDWARDTFGDADLFELQDLLVSPLGANLRNEVAHGLRNDGQLFDPDMLYAWGLLLRYCVATSLNVQARASGGSREFAPDS